MTRHDVRRRAGQGIVALLIALGLCGGSAGALPDAAAAPRDRHCIHPLGFDMNEVSNTNHRIITTFCTVALVGELWIPAAAWTTNATYDVIPEGYTPSGATPMEDYSAKFVGARYVIDAGTRHQRTFRFGASRILQVLRAPGSDFPTASIMAVLPPLPAGRHTVDIFLTLSADHWDGFGDDPSSNLWPAGETHCSRVEFIVERRNR
jgi:hypothetical protein